jgi:hypothetical protein
MNVERSRIALLGGAVVLALDGARSFAWPQARPGVTVYKSPT